MSSVKLPDKDKFLITAFTTWGLDQFLNTKVIFTR